MRKDILGESIWRSMGPAGPYSPGGVLMLAINRLQRFGVSPSTLYRNAAGPESPKMLMMEAQTERLGHLWVLACGWI